jgi:hypothetical protein
VPTLATDDDPLTIDRGPLGRIGWLTTGSLGPSLDDSDYCRASIAHKTIVFGVVAGRRSRSLGALSCCRHLLNAQYLQVRCKWRLFFVILDFARGPVV